MKRKLQKKPALKMGRPPLLTQPLADTIISYIKKGNYISTSFLASGVSDDLYAIWEDKAERGIKPYSELFGQIKQAYAEAETGLIGQIRRSGEPEQFIVERKLYTRKDGTTEETIRYAQPMFQANAWILERTRNDRYGERSNLTLQFSKGLAFVKKVQKAREQKAIQGEYKEVPLATITDRKQVTSDNVQYATQPSILQLISGRSKGKRSQAEAERSAQGKTEPQAQAEAGKEILGGGGDNDGNSCSVGSNDGEGR